jgi:SOS-response transcriptional repressor LexA
MQQQTYTTPGEVVSYTSRMKTLGERLEYYRTLRGYSMKELADLADTTAGTIGHIENGRNQSSKKLPAIAKALGVDLSTLLDGEGALLKPPKMSPAASSPVPVLAIEETVDLSSFDSELASREWLPAFKNWGKRTFAIRIMGDMMVNSSPVGPNYPDGSYVFIDPDLTTPKAGKRVLAIHNGVPTFREFLADSGYYFLKPLNNHYPVIQTEVKPKLIGVCTGCFIPE